MTLTTAMTVFPTDYASIRHRLETYNPSKYAKTRNFKKGSVSYLSPYISRGVLSTRQVFEQIRSSGCGWYPSEKFVQELAWRDHWQWIWRFYGSQIESNLKFHPRHFTKGQMPENVIHGNTKIHAVDKAIKEFYETGYMHNHMRMYVASLCCNIAKCDWKVPASWMYYHLLDGDLASNHLSWQWVAGSYSNKLYYANQENINKYFDSDQTDSYLDVDYAQIGSIETPQQLETTIDFQAQTELLGTTEVRLRKNCKTLIYNYYNLDPLWHKEQDVQRVLLLEPSVFAKYPVSPKCIQFALSLAKNIDNIKLFVGEFSELLELLGDAPVHFKEHPLNLHYKGIEEPREWLSSLKQTGLSFFKFWNQAKQELQFQAPSE